MDEYPIRSVAFGGFHKEDVAQYIEKLSKELNEQKEEAEKLKSRAESAGAEAEQLRAELAEATARRDELAAEAERLAPLAAEAERLRAEAEQLRADAESYRQLRDNVGQIECDARKRADDMERTAYAALRQVTEQFRARYQELMSTFEGAAGHVTAELRQVEVNLAQLPRAMDRPGAELNELAALLKKK